jgi:DNA invertase Pin-like site-specific DNA recombinase
MKSGKLIPYGRKSSGEDDTLSRKRQETAIRSWATLNGVELLPFVWEARVSGSRHWRDRRLGDVIEAIERHEAAGLVVEEQSRLTRGSQLHAAELWDALAAADARLVVTAEGIDTSQGDHELSFSIKAALARDQWKQFKRRSDAVKEDRVAAGVWIGPAPLGYLKKKSARLEVDPAWAPTVVRLFELRAEGASWGDLLRHADEATGVKLTQQGVAGIIRNRAYLGEQVYGDLANLEAHEPLVDVALWHAAQRLGKEPARSGRKSAALLSGRLRCSACLHTLIVWRGARTRNGKPRPRIERRYRCTNRSCQRRASIDAYRAEEQVRRELAGMMVERPRSTIEADPALEENLETAERRLEQVMADGVADDLGELWAPEVRKRREARDAAARALGEARVEAKTGGSFWDAYQELDVDKATDEQLREAMDGVFSVITVDADGLHFYPDEVTGEPTPELPRRGQKS